jgi:hypothetical protein
MHVMRGRLSQISVSTTVTRGEYSYFRHTSDCKELQIIITISIMAKGTSQLDLHYVQLANIKAKSLRSHFSLNIICIQTLGIVSLPTQSNRSSKAHVLQLQAVSTIQPPHFNPANTEAVPPSPDPQKQTHKQRHLAPMQPRYWYHMNVIPTPHQRRELRILEIGNEICLLSVS